MKFLFFKQISIASSFGAVLYSMSELYEETKNIHNVKELDYKKLKFQLTKKFLLEKYNMNLSDDLICTSYNAFFISQERQTLRDNPQIQVEIDEYVDRNMKNIFK